VAAGRARRGPPQGLYFMLETPRALLETASLVPFLPMLMRAPRGDGHPVLVLPGFTVDDSATTPLRTFLRYLGYTVESWELGRNVELPPTAIDRLVERFDAIPRRDEQKVSIVGQSLGGVYARELAKRRPKATRRVIALGAPFRGEAGGHDFRWIHRLMRGHEISEAGRAALNNCAERPDVPVTSVYTRSDGVVAWRSCLEDEGHGVDNIGIHGSHAGMAVNPGVLWAIADRLAQRQDEWRPFSPQGAARVWFA